MLERVRLSVMSLVIGSVGLILLACAAPVPTPTVTPAPTPTKAAAAAPTPPKALPTATPVPVPRNPLDGAGALTLVAGGFQALEGPQWVTSDGVLLFVDSRTKSIYKLTPPSDVTLFRELDLTPLGLALDPQGRLLVAGGGRVTRMFADGTIQTVADRQSVGRDISPNDLAVRSDGTIYFTSSRSDGNNAVFRIGLDGSVATVWEAGPNAGPNGPNGIALSPDQATLYVGYYNERVIRAFEIRADGSTGNMRIVAKTASSADGMTVDRDGNIFVATSPGVQVFSPDGKLWDTINVPPPDPPLTPNWGIVTNSAFAGPNATTLYITGQKALYRIEVSIPGIY